MSDDFMPMGMPPVMVAYEDFSLFMAQEDRIKQLQSSQAVLLEALERIIEPLSVWLGEHTHNVKINPGDEHSDELSFCDECRTVLDEHGYDTGCETGWIMEAVDIAQQAIKAVKE